VVGARLCSAQRLRLPASLGSLLRHHTSVCSAIRLRWPYETTMCIGIQLTVMQHRIVLAQPGVAERNSMCAQRLRSVPSIACVVAIAKGRSIRLHCEAAAFDWNMQQSVSLAGYTVAVRWLCAHRFILVHRQIGERALALRQRAP
jgi:hypothetical protein